MLKKTPRMAADRTTRMRRAELGWRLFWRRLLSPRDNELAIMAIAALLGVAAGFGVVLLREGVSAFHAIAFGISVGAHLSDGLDLDWWRLIILPSGGGLIVGLAAMVMRRWRPGDIVDAIEANALYGGRMSLTDSFNLGILTLLSGGFGASVGLEAAYTQIGAGLCSTAGTALRLRREDLRTLVGCGAAAAIAAAFNAPLAGAFYAFELIIGSYNLKNLAPITVAALAGTFAARFTFGAEPVFIVDRAVHIATLDYFLFSPLGLASALLGIIVMRGVTATEQWFRQRSTPNYLRPLLGGFVVGAIALIYPSVLGSGHGGIVANLNAGFTLPYLTGLIAAKIAASAISIGSGFRGGLFSTSLFLGSLFGGAIAIFIIYLWPTLGIDPLAYTVVGMGAVAAAIVGAPLTMILLVLEGTGDLSATIGVTVGVLTATIAARHWFGYSFATWRFHLRGLNVLSPEDIGWTSEFKVRRLMRSDPKTVPVTATITQLRKAFPLGSTRQVFAVDGGRFAGVIDLAEIHSPDRDADADVATAARLIHGDPPFVRLDEDIRSALARFTEAKVETLAVIDDLEKMRIVGYLSEAYVLRRYNQELERRRGQSGAEFGSAD